MANVYLELPFHNYLILSPLLEGNHPPRGTSVLDKIARLRRLEICCASPGWEAVCPLLRGAATCFKSVIS